MMSSQFLNTIPQETTPPLLGSRADAGEDDHSDVSMAMIQYRLTSHIEIMSPSLGGRLRVPRDVFGYNLYCILTNNDASLFFSLVFTTGRPN